MWNALDGLARLIGYGVLVWGAVRLLALVAADRAAARRLAEQRQRDEALRLSDPDAYDREVTHRTNMERLRQGLPVDPQWAAGMERAARSLRAEGLLD